MKNTRYATQFRRKREGKTDYKKRACLLLSGRPRVIIRKTLKRMIVQIATPGSNGDILLLSAYSSSLKKYGWSHGANISTSYLTGYMAGIAARKKGINEGVLDIGSSVHSKGGRIYAALKGLVDAGVAINHDPSVFPVEERLTGKHIKASGISDDIASVKTKLMQGNE
ncbi:50S ribosomal protein L18 [Candidatus Woesearchaeota archaeon]|nr:50S ribosomal protein L18 [Candidatus Woesearchaeota archaeon]